MAKFNGHKNWNHWNVSLWINNDEGLYLTAREFKRRYHTQENAARSLFNYLTDAQVTKTPDGAPYSISAIRAAMSEM